MLIDNQLYSKKERKTSNGSKKERIIFPRVYYRKKGNGSFELVFETKGNKFQEKFLSFGDFLESAFSADLIGKKDEKGRIVYVFVSDVYKNRISITEMIAEKGRILLMRGLYWEFDKDPHLLIGGGTGGGKTITILSLIYSLMRIADIEICDPKNSDLMALGRLKIFEGKVHTGKAMIDCLDRVVEKMDQRYKKMNESPEFKMGKNYAYYGFKPLFVIVDEWAAWMAEISNDYKLVGNVEDNMTQLILKARQCGIFFITAMQRPDGEYLKTSVRDNFMFRMSIGRLSETGYWMLFGDENKNKKFKYVEEINSEKVYGRSYVAKGGDLAREFYSPFVPAEFDFIEEFIKVSNDLGYEEESTETIQKVKEIINDQTLLYREKLEEQQSFLEQLGKKYDG